MSDFFPLSIEADRLRPITPEYGVLRGECWTTFLSLRHRGRL